MRSLLFLLAAATAVTYAQDKRISRALVRLQVTDKVCEEALALARQKAPKEQLRKLKVHQPYTLVLSGVAISGEGDIVTMALHPLASLRILVTLHDGSKHTAKMVGTDPRSNLAVVRVPVPTPDYVDLSDLKVTERQELRLIGHAKDKALDVSGMVAQTGVPVALRDLYFVNGGRPIKLGAVFLVATPTAGLNPGSVCVDDKGRFAGLVIGDLPPRAMKGAGQANPPLPVYQLAFVVPAPRVKRIVGQLRQYGRVIRSYYGVQLLPVESQVRAHFDLPKSASSVFKVEDDTPASRAGLRVNDIVLSVDGEMYRNTYELGVAMGDTPPGTTVKLQVLRSGKKLDLELVPVERK